VRLVAPLLPASQPQRLSLSMRFSEFGLHVIWPMKSRCGVGSSTNPTGCVGSGIPPFSSLRNLLICALLHFGAMAVVRGA
jgi:hypothetical protein